MTSRNHLGICLSAAILLFSFSLPVLLALGYEQDPGASRQATPDHEWPPVPTVKNAAEKPEVIQEAYAFAGEHSDILHYVPCYCVCGEKYGHKSNEDCFIKAHRQSGKSGTWNPHAAECGICLSVAMEARRLYLQGLSLRAIRDSIDESYGPKFKHRTDAPEPPSEHEKDDRN